MILTLWRALTLYQTPSPPELLPDPCKSAMAADDPVYQQRLAEARAIRDRALQIVKTLQEQKPIRPV